MKISFLLMAFFVFQMNTAEASFFDRPDYFENKSVYDEVEEIIELLHDSSLSEKDRELRLMFKDKKLVPTFKALKVENENQLIQSLKLDELTDNEILTIMSQRPVIDALKVTMENDFVSGTDVNYTNGLRVELSFNNPEFEKFFKKLGYDHSDFFFLCGQNIYNNSDKDNPSRIPDEPPNAGVLYCGSAVNSYKMDKNKARIRSMQRLEATLGSIGKNSFAEQVQNGFHRIIDSKQVNWDYQLSDRFYFNINFQKHLKLGEGDLYGNSEPEYNVIVNAGGNVGTFTNYANAGVMFNYRLLGTLIDMYVGNKITPSQIEELAMMSLENRLKKIICGSSRWSLNLYFGADVKYVFNNYWLDGSDLHYTESEPLVIDLKGGVVVRYRKVFFEVGLVRRSSEWGNTQGGPDSSTHTFGMASFTVRYDNFRELGDNVAHPIRWIADPEYRRKKLEENRIRDMIAKQGVKVIYDDGDPKNPKKTFNITCRAN